MDLLDEVTTTVSIAGACNAVRRDADGRLIGDMFDGEGFVRGLRRKGRALSGARVLVIGSGGDEEPSATTARIAIGYHWSWSARVDKHRRTDVLNWMTRLAVELKRSGMILSCTRRLWYSHAAR